MRRKLFWKSFVLGVLSIYLTSCKTDDGSEEDQLYYLKTTVQQINFNQLDTSDIVPVTFQLETTDTLDAGDYLRPDSAETKQNGIQFTGVYFGEDGDVVVNGELPAQQNNFVSMDSLRYAFYHYSTSDFDFKKIIMKVQMDGLRQEYIKVKFILFKYVDG